MHVTTKLARVIHVTLSLGIVFAVGAAASAIAAPLPASGAGQQSASSKADTKHAAKKPKTLEAIQVTGSHIRRVDLVTSNPVTRVSTKQIQATGQVTLGSVLQQLPSYDGFATNQQMVRNNVGQTGISLRGVGASRTLVLIDGHRYLNPDLNLIPPELVQRVDVLKSGASSVYGSDAVGGVVNIILKHNLNGAEFSTNYGISSKHDGVRHGATLMFGTSGAKGNFIVGFNYNKQDGIPASARTLTREVTLLKDGKKVLGGSNYIPTGLVNLPDTLSGQFGCGQATLNHGTGQSLRDYRCFDSATDFWNYDRNRYVLLPSERTNGFFLGNYRVNDDLTLFGEVFYNNTRSRYSLMPPQFDTTNDGVTISENSLFNPFGINFGGTGGSHYQTLLSSFGSSITRNTTSTGQGTVGLKGGIGPWDWQAYYNYGRETLRAAQHNALLMEGPLVDALGPSMMIDGAPACVTVPGDSGTAIPGCTPINIFDSGSPAVANQLAPYIGTLYNQTLLLRRAFYASANGPLVHIPGGGEAQLALGIDYQKEYEDGAVDSARVVNSEGNCLAGLTNCSGPLNGSFNVKEAYAELFLPIIRNKPLAYRFNLDLGDRYSRYSQAGESSDWKIGLEWRPIRDLLVRGTAAEVFRAPTIANLFTTRGAPILTTLNDPCVGLSAGELTGHSNACAGVPVEWQGAGQTVSEVAQGSIASGVSLKPEFGKTFDYGIVYEPHFISGFSTNVDFWRIDLHDTITTPKAEILLNSCFADNGNPLCAFFTRNPDTHLPFFTLPTVNLGDFDISGIDFGVKYQLPQVEWLPGRWNVNFNSSYIKYANFNTDPGILPPTKVAGQMSAFGTFPRIKMLANLFWSMGPWTASWQAQFIGAVQAGNASPGQHESADSILPNFVEKAASVLYNNLQVGYEIRPIHASVNVGINNLFDRSAPYMTESDFSESGTDVQTYDMIGRYYWANVNFRF